MQLYINEVYILLTMPSIEFFVCFSADKEEKEISDSGAETQNSEGAADEDPFGPKCFYNKAKSFFDNISSELKSRCIWTGCIFVPFP